MNDQQQCPESLREFRVESYLQETYYLLERKTGESAWARQKTVISCHRSWFPKDKMSTSLCMWKFSSKNKYLTQVSCLHCGCRAWSTGFNFRIWSLSLNTHMHACTHVLAPNLNLLSLPHYPSKCVPSSYPCSQILKYSSWKSPSRSSGSAKVPPGLIEL